MIGYIEGEITGKRAGNIIVNVNGVGYVIHTISTTALKDGNITLHTYLAVRENALDLYGFETEEELHFFELLLTVSGIGPKSALGTLESAGTISLKQSISKGDPALLSKLSGIGKKTAEKIVLELKGKIDTHDDIESASTHGSEAIDALLALGYSERQAREVYEKLDTEDKTTEEIIREALKHIS